MKTYKFNILNKALALVKYTMAAVDKSPKKTRDDIGAQIRKSAVEIIRLINTANYYNSNIPEENSIRRKYQTDAIVETSVLDNLCAVAEDMGYITKSQYSQINEIATQLNTMLENWRDPKPKEEGGVFKTAAKKEEKRAFSKSNNQLQKDATEKTVDKKDAAAEIKKEPSYKRRNTTGVIITDLVGSKGVLNSKENTEPEEIIKLEENRKPEEFNESTQNNKLEEDSNSKEVEEDECPF